jgi:predicted N-acyltransferase
MADREAELTARVATGVAGIDAATWAGLAGGDPLTGHAFLALLEESGSVGQGTGWTALPILAERGGSAVGAAPAYLKTHSQGEYVFDHGWAEAWERAGQAYYPKLQVAVPFTPCPGRRLLGEAAALLAAIEAVTVQNRLSSAHVTFCTEAEARVAEARGWLVRHGLQFHWFNRGYASFEDFLGRLASRKRKAIRKERERAVEGLEIVTLRGAEIGPAQWDSMWTFYQDTGSRKWGQPYLTRDFFDRVHQTMRRDVLLVLAERDGTPVAGALNFIGRHTLYGRYWGCTEEHPCLHFELCYYQAIDHAIAHGLRVEAGAQGEHKLARGYLPAVTHSLHWIADPGFRRAVERFLQSETRAVGEEIEILAEHGPFRHTGEDER